MLAIFAAALAAVAPAVAQNASALSLFLKESSDDVFPSLRDIAVEIFENPELGLDEHRAHDLIVSHFSGISGWDVTPSAYGLDTAFSLVYENRPEGFEGELTTIGFLCEYDALIIGHACGHNHIALSGMLTASLAVAAMEEYNIPGRIQVIGCPDEENAAGKFALNEAGAFDGSDIWMMAHPTSQSAIQPMNARLDLFPLFAGDSHQEAVRKAYEAMVVLRDLDTLPGTASSVSLIQNIGVYAVNVVQSEINVGVSGASREKVQDAASSILDDTFPGVTFTTEQDSDGVAVQIKGPGGHASETTKSALDLSIDLFRALSNDSSLSFYIPGNTTANEFEITANLRTRFTVDIPELAQFISDALGTLASELRNDLKYPALEIQPILGQALIDLLATPEYGLTDWELSDFAPASTDASWIQSADVDPETHELLGLSKVVLHANYGICNTESGEACAFNHEPGFRDMAGTDFSYTQTEIVARAEAQMAVDLLTNTTWYDEITAKVRK